MEKKQNAHHVNLLMLFFIVVIQTPVSAGGATAQQDVLALLSVRKYSLHDIGIQICDVDRDTTLVAVNGDTLFNPASVTKLVTGAVAFEKLGTHYQFSTRVYIDKKSVGDSGLVRGNLYIQGSADPGFTAERLWLFVEHLYTQGVRTISGNLVLDDYLFDSLRSGPGLDEDSTSRSYQPVIGALEINSNSIEIHHHPGSRVGDPVAIDFLPEVSSVKIQSTALTVAHGKKSALDIITVPCDSITVVRVQGCMVLGEPGDITYRKLWQTWESFGGAMQSLFKKRGIVLKGSIVHAKIPGSVKAIGPLFEFTSPPLVQNVNDMFKYSLNYNAEVLFKLFSAKRDTVQGSWEKSQEMVASWWKERKLPGTPIIKNGSGMGNTNRMSPAQTVALLSYVRSQKSYWPDYCAALSNAGIDGTLKSRFVKSKLRGIVRAKTGTLNNYGISTLAGYVLLQGKTLGFAIYCSKAGKGQFDNWQMQEQILEKVVETLK